VSESTISTELIRRFRNQRPARLTDYRDARVPGFVLRVRPSGVHLWRVQLPDRRWLTLGRVDKHHWRMRARKRSSGALRQRSALRSPAEGPRVM
jgi:hypothetical protein